MAVDATKLRRGLRRLGEPPTDSNPELVGQPPDPATAESGGGGVAIAAADKANQPAAPPRPARLADTRAPASPDRLHRSLASPPPGATASGGYIDGRSRRRTGRIEQINVKVSAQFNSDLRGLADRDGLLIVEVLERALDAYLKVSAAAEASGQTVGQILDRLQR